MDVWPVGRAPAGAYVYPFPAEHTKRYPEHEGAKVRPALHRPSCCDPFADPEVLAQVFFLPMRVIRGQAQPNKAEGLVDFAWLTKEEVKETVSEDYWTAVEPILSDR